MTVSLNQSAFSQIRFGGFRPLPPPKNGDYSAISIGYNSDCKHVYLSREVGKALNIKSEVAAVDGLHQTVRRYLQTLSDIYFQDDSRYPNQPYLMRDLQEKGVPEKEVEKITTLVFKLKDRVNIAMGRHPNDPPSQFLDNIDIPLTSNVITREPIDRKASIADKIRGMMSEIFPTNSERSILTTLKEIGVEEALLQDVANTANQLEEELLGLCKKHNIPHDNALSVYSLPMEIQNNAETPTVRKNRFLCTRISTGVTGLELLQKLHQLDRQRRWLSRQCLKGTRIKDLHQALKIPNLKAEAELQNQLHYLESADLIRATLNDTAPEYSRWGLTEEGKKLLSCNDPMTAFKIPFQEIKELLESRLSHLEKEKEHKTAHWQKTQAKSENAKFQTIATACYQRWMKHYETEKRRLQESLEKVELTIHNQKILAMQQEFEKSLAGLGPTGERGLESLLESVNTSFHQSGAAHDLTDLDSLLEAERILREQELARSLEQLRKKHGAGDKPE